MNKEDMDKKIDKFIAIVITLLEEMNGYKHTDIKTRVNEDRLEVTIATYKDGYIIRQEYDMNLDYVVGDPMMKPMAKTLVNYIMYKFERGKY